MRSLEVRLSHRDQSAGESKVPRTEGQQGGLYVGQAKQKAKPVTKTLCRTP